MASWLRMPGQPFSAIRPSKTILPVYPVTASRCQCRDFSQTVPHDSKMNLAQKIPIKQPAQPTMKSRSRNMLKSNIPQDLGLLQGTFIRPMWKDMPSIFEQRSERLQMEWLWIKYAFQNFLGVVTYCKWLNSKMKILYWERRRIARDLHKQMYTAFADGDIGTLRKICCPGLANDLASRINRRRRDEKVTWHLDKYIRSPGTYFTGVRIVSDRATKLPNLDDSGIRQIVVRITSEQSKAKLIKSPKTGPGDSGNAVTTQPTTQECTEHIVIQQLRLFGENGPWMIWGHTTPTTIEDLDNPLFARGLSAAERYQALMASMGRK